MREVYYHDWLSNPVMVKKHDGSWRMYVDFTNLNKACPQDCYPLLKIDLKVESLCGYPFKCFLDAYKGYHQIQMAELDEKKTAFHTPHGVYYYIKMPFDIKNARDTYQRLVDKAFEKQVVRNLEVLIVVEGTFLGYMVGPKGIKPCPEKIEAVLKLLSPRTIKEVQSLNGKLAGLNRWFGRRVRGITSWAAYRGIDGGTNVHVSVDSKLVANQVTRTYIAKEENMIKYLEKVLVEVLLEKSIQEKVVAAVVEEEGPTWMTPITEYLKDGVLSDDKKEANKLRIKARQYELMDGILYRRLFLRPWLRRVGPLQGDYVIREIHEGSCSMHAGPRSVVAKAMRSRYYWPTMHRDARDMLLKCKDCQGINIAGPFLNGPEKVNFLIVNMYYFTKWIEAKAVATISGGQIEEIPYVLWAHRTMIKSSNRDTPFSLNYGTEVVIPVEIGMPTYRTAIVDVVHNDDEIRLNLNLLEDRHERATIREAKAKSKMIRYYNARVRGVTFKPGDYVYRINEVSHAMDGGKLEPKWEGPYEVTEVLGGGAYKLRSMDGAVLPRTWNIANLKKCYL
ncbi:reverse transcriptase domain-containing protein [Tanacetum coccineum]